MSILQPLLANVLSDRCRLGCTSRSLYSQDYRNEGCHVMRGDTDGQRKLLHISLDQFIEQHIEFGDFSLDLSESERMFSEAWAVFSEHADALAMFADCLENRGGTLVEDVATGESVWKGARLRKTRA